MICDPTAQNEKYNLCSVKFRSGLMCTRAIHEDKAFQTHKICICACVELTIEGGSRRQNIEKLSIARNFYKTIDMHVTIHLQHKYAYVLKHLFKLEAMIDGILHGMASWHSRVT